MAFDFNTFMTQVRADNSHYERFKTSRLHSLVDQLRLNPHLTAYTAQRLIQSVPPEVWTKYQHARAYLVTEFGIAGAEVPAGQNAVLSKEVFSLSAHYIEHHEEYHGGAGNHQSSTGRIDTPDRGIMWSVEVVYTLHDSIDTTLYFPFRQAKECHSLAGKGFQGMQIVAVPALPEAQVRANARNAIFRPDGPAYYNVRREPHTICIWDGPGTYMGGQFPYKASQFPMRDCSYFQMSLYRIRAGIDLAATFNGGDYRGKIGMELPGSRVAFHYYMARETKLGGSTGDFVVDA